MELYAKLKMWWGMSKWTQKLMEYGGAMRMTLILLNLFEVVTHFGWQLDLTFGWMKAKLSCIYSCVALFFVVFFFNILRNILFSFGTDNDWRLLVMNLVFVYIAIGRIFVQVVAVRNSIYLLAPLLAHFRWRNTEHGWHYSSLWSSERCNDDKLTNKEYDIRNEGNRG